jgi:hypothetical protein
MSLRNLGLLDRAADKPAQPASVHLIAQNRIRHLLNALRGPARTTGPRDATINGRPGADPTGSAPSDTAKRGSDLADTRPKGHDGIPDHIRPPPAQGPDWLPALMRMSVLLFDLQAQGAWPTRLRQQTRKTPRRPRPVTTLLTSMLSFGLADSLSGHRASCPRR